MYALVPIEFLPYLPCVAITETKVQSTEVIQNISYEEICVISWATVDDKIK
jgi:hypothetical protein